MSFAPLFRAVARSVPVLLALALWGCGTGRTSSMTHANAARGADLPARGGGTDACPAHPRLAASASIGVGTGAGPLAADGSEVWVARPEAGSVTRVGLPPASTAPGGSSAAGIGGVAASRRVVFHLGGAPVSIAVGFGRIWVALRDAGGIVSIGAGDSPPVRMKTPVPVPVKVLASNSELWVLSLDSSALYPLDPHSGDAGEPIYSPVGDPIDMALAGGELWLLGADEGGLSPVNANLGRVVRSGFDLPGRALGGLSSSGSTLWMGEPSRGSLLRIDAADVGVSELRAPAAVRPDLTAVGSCGVWVASHAGLLDLVDSRSGVPLAPALRIGRSIAALAASGVGVWASDPLDGTVVYVSSRRARRISPRSGRASMRAMR